MPSPTSINVNHPAAPLLHALQSAVLPSSERKAQEYFVIARSKRKQLVVPPQVKIVPLKLRGSRTAVRTSRTFERVVLLSARWDKDGMHELRTPKIVAVVNGQMGFRAGDYVLQCPTGTVIFLPPGVPHTNNTFSHLETLPSEIRRCSLLWLTPMMSGLACRMCHSEGEEHRTGMHGEKVFLHRPHVMQLFNLLAEEVENLASTGYDDDGEVVAGVFSLLMRVATRDITREQYLLQDVPPHEHAEYSSGGDVLGQAIAYLDTHFATALTLDDIARRFWFSRADFTRKFRQRTGQSFLQYLNARRIEQASTLLRDTNWTAAMIAHYVGFASPAHFHRLFVRSTGQTPMLFRANRHGNISE
jgi:AraC-like DNA-binding protein